jgi:hypothetical protein
VSQPEWEWAITPSDDKHADRFPMMRAIEYEMIRPTGPELFKEQIVSRQGKALTLNISSRGMLLLMDQAPGVAEVLKVYVPTPINQARTPTLAQVAWTRPVPLAPDTLQFVGLKFVI